MALPYPVPLRKISHGRGVSKTRRISRGLHSLSALWAPDTWTDFKKKIERQILFKKVDTLIYKLHYVMDMCVCVYLYLFMTMAMLI